MMPKKIIWTRHAEARQKEWERIRGITRLQVEQIIMNPEQIVPGDLDALVAQTRNRGGLIRIPFLEKDAEIKLLTVYWTSKIEKYWRETE